MKSGVSMEIGKKIRDYRESGGRGPPEGESSRVPRMASVLPWSTLVPLSPNNA